MGLLRRFRLASLLSDVEPGPPGTKDRAHALKILATNRLLLRELSTDDAAFILELVNGPGWLRFIGDRGIRTLEAARDYLLKGSIEMYARLGFGLWLVERQDEHLPVGICGLLKRETLADIELGFAILGAHQRKGYALEAARATLAYASATLGITRIVAITSLDNEDSRRLLMRLGFVFERRVRLSDPAPELNMYAAVA